VALLDACPGVREHFKRHMRGASPFWAALVKKWNLMELSLRLESQAGGALKNTNALIKHALLLASEAK
jgi:phage regulator Rha-like protein